MVFIINKAFWKLHDYFPTLDIDRIQAELSIPPPCTLSISSLIEWFRESKICTDPYPECFKLLSIYLCIPVTTATCERTFSTLRILNNFLRSKMGQEQLMYFSLNCILQFYRISLLILLLLNSFLLIMNA